MIQELVYAYESHKAIITHEKDHIHNMSIRTKVLNRVNKHLVQTQRIT